MPANIGEMFYYGEIPWHKEGTELELPANSEEAIEFGGLDWEVETVGLKTDEEPPSKVDTRFAIVRKDIPKGHAERVVGVAHKDFRPLQNREGIRIFDSIFGRGKRVYHTGGYLGVGEAIWLLAELPKKIRVLEGDEVMPYALFTNSHNGSIAIDFRLTTVRVVCQNTLSLALNDDMRKTVFKRSHQGSYAGLENEVKAFFADTLNAVDDLEAQFRQMVYRKFDDDLVKEYVESLFPMPVRPKKADVDSRVERLFMARLQKIERAQEGVNYLRKAGLGMDLPGVQGSLWATFNAVLEYVDHHAAKGAPGISSTLLGTGAALKRKAFDLAAAYLQ